MHIDFLSFENRMISCSGQIESQSQHQIKYVYKKIFMPFVTRHQTFDHI